MIVKFFGAARTVTGSKHMLILKSGKKILLDCGLFQNTGKDNDTRNRNFGFNPAEINCMILSHAHMDHSGNIPNLVKQGFTGKIFATPATIDLCKIMLSDSAHIQEHDVQYLNKKRIRKGYEPLKPLYDQSNVDATIKLFLPVDYNTPFAINDELTFHFTDSGHILGSAAVNMQIIETSKKINLFFSGDIGRPTDLILKAPEPFPQADYIITESTYGNRLHEDTVNAQQKLMNAVLNTCVQKKGKLIIPAFSLGRTQEIVYSLDRMRSKNLIPQVNVYVDSPLSTNATSIMRKYPECFNADIREYMKADPDPFGFNTLRYIRDVVESKQLNESNEPCIIIAPSGMMEAGRIKHHLKNNISNEKNTVLIVGYCPPDSLGGRFLAGNKTVKIFGEEYEVRADIEEINSYSAHGDYQEMIAYLNCQNKAKIKKMFLVHGDYDVQTSYRETLLKSGFSNIEIPAEQDEFELI